MKVKIHCKLSEAKTGMLLAEDVYDLQGKCLIASGLILTEAKLASIQTRHIGGLIIWQEQTFSKNEITEQREAIKASLAHRFRQMQDNSEMLRLLDILLAYRMDCFDEQEKGLEPVIVSGEDME